VPTLTTRASSINRALDEVGDTWCLLILQEVFWGTNTFSGLLAATGASRGVLSDRLRWLQGIGCLRKAAAGSYRLTRKSMALYHCALMAVEWERRYHRAPALDAVLLRHIPCGRSFSPRLRCTACQGPVNGRDVNYAPGPGAALDRRPLKVRRRSTRSLSGARGVYRNLVYLVGDRWSANLVALAFHGFARFEQFHRELPLATNILADRLRSLVDCGVFAVRAYQQRPRRFEYYLTEKGWDLFPFFLTLLQWGDRWCDGSGAGPPLQLSHSACGAALHGEVVCDGCGEVLRAYEVSFAVGDALAGGA
jgi:DNA-binding HxlR family transcriptional regulator